MRHQTSSPEPRPADDALPLPRRSSRLGPQVSAAFVALTLLFIAAGLHALGAFQRQRV
ncbi:hypothetical protein [Marichromatium gracile]|uniref:hypothetical protein n=1 Tax=Marichromatium gracile TaxID=1048 RepID=UPI001365EFCF|nr:hypothetical protein [Marichromatium gracile]